MLKINYLSTKEGTPASGYWDMAFLEDLLADLPDSRVQVFVIPAAYQADMIPAINAELNKHDHVLVFITSDEEHKFPTEQLRHPSMYVFEQYKGTFPLGYTPQTRTNLKREGYQQKTIPWFYSGQINHIRRRQLQDVLVRFDYDRQWFYPTDGFAKGMNAEDYFFHMSRAKVVPAPPGNVTQDSFRLYEALEAGAVPIADRFSAQGEGGYWEKMFPDAPFPVLSSYMELPGLIEQCQDQELRNRVYAWWIAKKMKLRQQFKDILGIREALTVIVPTSYIPSHPSTEVIDQTIASIRYHTGADIILTIDGLRPEHAEMSNDYTEYISRLLWKCNFEYENVHPILFEEHTHQAGMMKKALEQVHTDLVMYVEHDTPLVTDEPIDWGFLVNTLMKAEAFVIRFHFEARIPEEHKYLMLPENDKPNLIATRQWSQRPHIARTNFYRGIMQLFSENANCFIEDYVHGKCQEGNWDDWKLFIYAPGENIKRSLNLDGRAGGAKYDDKQIW